MNINIVPFRHTVRTIATSLTALSLISGIAAAQQRAAFSGVVGAAELRIVTFSDTALLPVPPALQGEIIIVREGRRDAIARIVRIHADPNRYVQIAVAGPADRIGLCARSRCASFHIVRAD